LQSRCALYLKQGKPELALGDLERALRLQPGLPVPPETAGAYLARAKTRLGKGKPDLAIQDLGQAIRLDAKLAEAFQLRASIHRERMDFADALADLERASKADPARAAACRTEIEAIRSQMA
jgi:tetratricopeptide (TPR) repeat protein